MDAVTDDVFIDDISFQRVDGYSLAATLFMPRGPRHHAVLINSATAVPRKIYAGFASYLAGRGCVVLTYDYRGTGGSQKAMVGYNQPKSLVGFKASMSDWAALDVTAAVDLDARALRRRCRSAMSATPSAARRWAHSEQQRGFARAVGRGPGRILEADDRAGALSRLRSC